MRLPDAPHAVCRPPVSAPLHGDLWSRRHENRTPYHQPADIPFRLQLLSCYDCSCRFDKPHFTPIHWHCYFKPVKIPTKNKETKQISRNSSMFEPAWFASLTLCGTFSGRERKHCKINVETFRRMSTSLKLDLLSLAWHVASGGHTLTALLSLLSV